MNLVWIVITIYIVCVLVVYSYLFRSYYQLGIFGLTTRAFRIMVSIDVFRLFEPISCLWLTFSSHGEYPYLERSCLPDFQFISAGRSSKRSKRGSQKKHGKLRSQSVAKPMNEATGNPSKCAVKDIFQIPFIFAIVSTFWSMIYVCFPFPAQERSALPQD